MSMTNPEGARITRLDAPLIPFYDGVEGRPPSYMSLKGKVIQEDFNIAAWVTAPKVVFTNSRIGAQGERIQMLEMLPNDSGELYQLTTTHPEDMLIERIAMVLTHPAMVREYFQLLKELDLPVEAADDYSTIKAALLRRL